MWDREGVKFCIVINEEEQYSIWPETFPVPAGWSRVGEARPKEECLQAIETMWTDLRPKSLRIETDCGVV